VVRDAAAWLSAHPRRADALLAALLFLFSAGQIPGGSVRVFVAFLLVNALLAAAVILRRQFPVQAFTAVAVIAAGQIVFGMENGDPGAVAALQPRIADVAIAVLLYTLAAHRSRRVSIAGLVICLLGVTVAVARWSPAHGAHSGGAVFGALAGLGGAAVTAWVLGDSVAYRYRRAYYAALEERAARLEAERDAQARIAAAAERARELQERRARAVDESAARLRRIERDLHDGAQVRLTALAMTLGEINEGLEAAELGPGEADRVRLLAGAAHRSAKQALTELRDLAHGIHPPVLDRGLGAALSALAEASPIPVRVNVDVAARPSPAIEAIAYFCAAELLANAAKHSGADHATVAVTGREENLAMTVADNGAGQARLVPGGGLAGLRERVQTVDGRLGIDSPPGGPTIVTIELPGHA
jgi:signal transduction histidine kinase